LCNFPWPAQLRSRLQIFHLLTDITVGVSILDLDDMDSPGLTYRKQEKNKCGNDSHGNQNALMRTDGVKYQSSERYTIKKGG